MIEARSHLELLFKRQNGKCQICGEIAIMGGNPNHKETAVRFRAGSGYGKANRKRKRVMAHRGCADQRSREIEMNIPIEYRQLKSGRVETEEWGVPER